MDVRDSSCSSYTRNSNILQTWPERTCSFRLCVTWMRKKDCTYSVDYVTCFVFQGDDGVDYEFGIKPSGLLVKKRGNVIGNYVWWVCSVRRSTLLHVCPTRYLHFCQLVLSFCILRPKISKLYFKGKKFYLSVWGKNVSARWSVYTGARQLVLSIYRVLQFCKTQGYITVFSFM